MGPKPLPLHRHDVHFLLFRAAMNATSVPALCREGEQKAAAGGAATALRGPGESHPQGAIPTTTRLAPSRSP